MHQSNQCSGAQKIHLNETVLLNTHNMFWLRNIKFEVHYKSIMFAV